MFRLLLQGHMERFRLCQTALGEKYGDVFLLSLLWIYVPNKSYKHTRTLTEPIHPKINKLFKLSVLVQHYVNSFGLQSGHARTRVLDADPKITNHDHRSGRRCAVGQQAARRTSTRKQTAASVFRFRLWMLYLC